VKRWRNDTPSAAAVPTDVTLRMVLKQSETGVKVLQREVRANLVYRGFTRVSGGKTPDAKTIGAGGGARARSAQAEPEAHGQIAHDDG
jgi:IS5 family transposase